MQKKEEGYELYGMINVSKGCRREPEAFVLRFSLSLFRSCECFPLHTICSHSLAECFTEPVGRQLLRLSVKSSQCWFRSGLRVHSKWRQTECVFSPFWAKTTLCCLQSSARQDVIGGSVMGAAASLVRPRRVGQGARTPVCLLLEFSV